MLKIFSLILFTFFLLLIMAFMNFFLMFNSEDKWKMSSLEAGFISTGKIHKSFSLQFFFIMVIFIIFDMEILMIFNFLLKSSFFIFMNLTIIIFLFLTLLIEWKWSKLIWLK